MVMGIDTMRTIAHPRVKKAVGCAIPSLGKGKKGLTSVAGMADNPSLQSHSAPHPSPRREFF